MPAGRPTLYNQEIIDKTLQYCQIYNTELDEVIPSIAGLSIYLDITRATVYEWAKDSDKPEFTYIVAKLLALQEKSLVKGGLTEDFNASITKLLLSKHGYSDTSHVDANVNSGLNEEEKAKLMALLNETGKSDNV